MEQESKAVELGRHADTIVKLVRSMFDLHSMGLGSYDTKVKDALDAAVLVFTVRAQEVDAELPTKTLPL